MILSNNLILHFTFQHSLYSAEIESFPNVAVRNVLLHIFFMIVFVSQYTFNFRNNI